MTDEKKEYLDSRFDQLDRRFDKIDSRFEQVTDLIETLAMATSQRFDQIDGRFDQVDRHFTSVEDEVRAIHGRLDSQASDLSLLQKDVRGLKQTLDENVLPRLSNLEAQVG